MKISAIFMLVATLVVTTEAFWRMVCHGRLGVARVDPLVSYGEVSQHAHSLHGSSGISETAQYADLVAGECTSCSVTQDHSAYWHPSLYFQHADGTYELVPQVGGMLAYYFLNPNGDNTSITAFPQGFRMIAGDSTRRNCTINGAPCAFPDPPQSEWGQLTQYELSQRALGFNCLNYNTAPEGSLYRHFLPPKSYLDANCLDGVRFELMFPSCWNGKDLDSPNHKDHVAYPDLVMDGVCPDGYDVKLPGLFYETIWNTYAFNGVAGQFVIANGDILGYGYHGDFMMGWEETILQAAVDTCTDLSGEISDCPIFNIQSDSIATNCNLTVPAALVSEAVYTGLTALPGNVAIQTGPGPAAIGPIASGASSPAATATAPSLGYSPGASATGSNYAPGDVFKELSTSTDGASSAPTAPVQVSTQYVTTGDIVSEIVWQMEVVTTTYYEDIVQTVTSTSSPAATTADTPYKIRRAAEHLHRHGHHGRVARH